MNTTEYEPDESNGQSYLMIAAIVGLVTQATNHYSSNQTTKWVITLSFLVATTIFGIASNIAEQEERDKIAAFFPLAASIMAFVTIKPRVRNLEPAPLPRYPSNVIKTADYN